MADEEKSKSDSEVIASERNNVTKRSMKPIWAKNQRLIRISDTTWERWNKLKSEFNCKSHDDFAGKLLDLWERFKGKDKDAENMEEENEEVMASSSCNKTSEVDTPHQSCEVDTVRQNSPKRDIISERKAICVNTELLKLANLRIKKICSQKFCNKMVTVTVRYIGTSAQLNWMCSADHHIYTWNSQPDIDSIPAVDFLLCSVLPVTDYPAIHITLRKIGITSTKETDEIEGMNIDPKDKESAFHGQSLGQSASSSHNPDFDYLQVKGEVDTEDNPEFLNSKIEELTSGDALMGHKEIKVEVTDDDEVNVDTESNSDTEEEYNDLYNYLSNSNKALKVPIDKDTEKDYVIKSERIKKKGFRPNYAALEWNEDGGSVNDAKSENSDDVKFDEDKNRGMAEGNYAVKTKRKSKAADDPDFQLFYEDYTEIIEKEKKVKKKPPKAPTKAKEGSTNRKRGPKRKQTSTGANESQQEKKIKIKKPWIKINLADHEDKYTIETVESFERKNRNIDASENFYSCLICNHYKCASKDAIENHIELHINKFLECDDCQYIAFCGTDIREHKQNCHLSGVKALFICPICGTFSCSNESKRNHMGKVHDISEWKCFFCPDLFKTRYLRLDHMRIVHPDPCQYCDSCKRSKHQLSKEEYKHHLENCSAKVPCHLCGMLVCFNGMNKHINDKHEKVRKHQCPKCPYSAKGGKRLKTHLLTHDNIHPYSCKQCSFTCIQPYQLKSHMRTHTGEKPYKCTQCRYAAAWNVQLKEHVKVHSMNTSISCQQCDIMFRNEKTLSIHTRKEHSMM